MEHKQTSQMVAWLDEERRKDKALIVKLEERAAAQSALIEDQARRVQSLEGEIAALRATSLSMSTFDESITRLRTETTAALEQLQRANPDQDIKKLRDLFQESVNNTLEGLREELAARIEREIQPRRAEEERLSRVAVELQNYADTLSKNLEDFQRTLSFLEEQRRQDSRRISDIGGAQTEVSKKVEAQQAKMELLEDLSRRNERTIAETAASLAEFKQQRQAAQDQEAVAARQREKVLGETLRRVEDSMKKFEKQVEGWTETAHTMKKQVDDFERLADRVERRLNEVSEIQRLSEERFRREWEEFQQEDQKRFRQFTLTNDESWRESNKIVNALSEKISGLTDASDQMSHHLAHLTALQNALMDGLTGVIQNLREQPTAPTKPHRARSST